MTWNYLIYLENLLEELIHYHLFVWRDGDTEEFDQEQKRLKIQLEQEPEED
jgi:hypothetical protein